MKITIQSATAADWDDWLNLRLQLWPDADTSEDYDQMRDFLNRSDVAILLARDASGIVVGLVEAGRRDVAEGCYSSPVGYIEGWFVADEYRRQGIGAQLIAAAEAWARAQGCREMASDCQLTNDVSLHAHLHLGYHEVERAIHFRKAL